MRLSILLLLLLVALEFFRVMREYVLSILLLLLQNILHEIIKSDRLWTFNSIVITHKGKLVFDLHLGEITLSILLLLLGDLVRIKLKDFIELSILLLLLVFRLTMVTMSCLSLSILLLLLR